MDAWAEEKRALLATIEQQERDAARLAKRFKLLQRTVVEQQALLDRFQRALQQQQTKGGAKIQESDPTETQLGDTQTTVACLAGGLADHVGAGDREDSLVATHVETKAIAEEQEQQQQEEEDAGRDEESATCLSPPLAAVEGEAPPYLALNDATVSAPLQTDQLVPQASSELKQREPIQPSASIAKAKEIPTTHGSKPSGEDASWTRRRAPELSNVSTSAATSTAAATPSADPPVSDGANAAATAAKRPRPAPAKWADVKKRRVAVAPASSTRPAAAAAVGPRDKENRQQTTVVDQPFAYVEVVRNREARAALPAHDCAECAKYYAALGDMVSAEQVAEHKRACSRHRARYQPYETPDDFWRLTFPDSEPTT